MDELDPRTCYAALVARDRRFDGEFLVAVSSTGIYCRPVCPARTPGRDRCAFYRKAAAAERDGYRPCLRCRPELAPGASPMEARPRLVEAALARIEAGELEEGSLAGLAARLGVSERHLRRAVDAELGLAPVELAQSARLALAKRLLTDTRLPIAQVAFASGFRSVRRFNALTRARWGKSPAALRNGAGGRGGFDPGEAIPLRLDYRPPLDWEALLAFLAARATPGIEEVAGDVYRRSLALRGKCGWVEVRPEGRGPALVARVSASLVGVIQPLVAGLRRTFDLDARPDRITAALGRDPWLCARVALRPGLRVPGSLDGFELAVRAVLGQQVTVKGATTLAGRLAARLGEPVETPWAGITRLAPTPEALRGAGVAGLARLGLPRRRAGTLVALAEAVASGDLDLSPGRDPGGALESLPGIGPWTAGYVAMRALGSPDGWPAGDLALRRALGQVPARELEARAEAWRPWRAYAAMQIWCGREKGKP